MKDILTFDAGTSRRSRDSNGFLIIKDNPVSKAGVYEYYGREVGDPDAGRLFKVYRPFEELRNIKDGFAGKPVLLEHEWVNPERMPPVRGAVTGEIREKEPYLYADITIYDAEAADAIENGSYAELSPGYLSDYDKKPGEFEGEPYDYVQRNIRFNHMALVRQGRTGKDLRVMDGKSDAEVKEPGSGRTRLIAERQDYKPAAYQSAGCNFPHDYKPAVYQSAGCNFPHDGRMERIQITGEDMSKNRKTQDVLDVSIGSGNSLNAPTSDEDKRELIREIMAVAAKPSSEFEGGEEEHERTIAELAEKLAYKPSEESETDDEEPDNHSSEETKAAPVKDANTASEAKQAFEAFAKAFGALLGEEEQEPAHRDRPEVGGTKTQDGKAKFVYRPSVKTLDAPAIEKRITSKIAAAQRAYEEVRPYTGTFNIYTSDSIMNESDIYAYAYRCIGGDPQSVADSKSAFQGHVAALSRKPGRTFDGTSSKEIEEMTSHIR